MKKILGFLAINLLIIATVLKAQVSVEAFPADPQSGPHNYFGVRVTLAQTYSENVTVTGFIYDEGGGANTNHPFSLTVIANDLTAETASNFYETDPTASAVADIGTMVIGYAGVSITYEINGCILKFNSVADLNAVLNLLEGNDNDYNDDYDSQYPNLTEEELDEMDEQNDFDEFKIYRDFETLFNGFCSKRVEIEATENTWLANDFSGTDPDDIDFTFDEAENTVFNNSYQLKIGNDTYEMRSTGLYNLTTNSMAIISEYSYMVFNQKLNFPYISRDANEKKLAGPNFNNLINSEKELNTQNSALPPICVSNVRNSQRFSGGSNREFKLKVAVNSSIIRNSAKGKVVSLKKKNGHWKRYRTRMAVGCAGNIYDVNAPGGCTLFEQPNRRNPTSGYKNKKSFKTIQRQSVPVKYGTMTNEFHSFYELQGGGGNSLIVF